MLSTDWHWGHGMDNRGEDSRCMDALRLVWYCLTRIDTFVWQNWIVEEGLKLKPTVSLRNGRLWGRESGNQRVVKGLDYL